MALKVRVALEFYREADLAAADASRTDVATAIALALGLWKGGAIQLDLKLLDDDGRWLGVERPYMRGGSGRRLDRYLTPAVLRALEKREGSADWKYLAERPAEVKILLRRLRYRLGQDFGSEAGTRRYAYWTTGTTEAWAARGDHQLEYLVHKLSKWSDELEAGHAAPADSLNSGFWGEVDTEKDRLGVMQVTTKSGATAADVQAVLGHAGAQLDLKDPVVTRQSDRGDPVKCFVEALTNLTKYPERLLGTDVLLVHRGGGVDPTTTYEPTNVSAKRRRELLHACLAIRDRGVEVVVAVGHANISVLTSPAQVTEVLPLGVFEATTPTAGADWILQEHINPRLVDTSLMYHQPRERLRR